MHDIMSWLKQCADDKRPAGIFDWRGVAYHVDAYYFGAVALLSPGPAEAPSNPCSWGFLAMGVDRPITVPLAELTRQIEALVETCDVCGGHGIHACPSCEQLWTHRAGPCRECDKTTLDEWECGDCIGGRNYNFVVGLQGGWAGKSKLLLLAAHLLPGATHYGFLEPSANMLVSVLALRDETRAVVIAANKGEPKYWLDWPTPRAGERREG